MTGRPFRFLAYAMGGWTAVRVAFLWPTIETLPDLIRAIVPPAAAAEPTAFYAQAPIRADLRIRAHRVFRTDAETHRSPPPPSPPAAVPPLATGIDDVAVEPAPPRLAGIDSRTGEDRLAISLWGIARQGLAGSRFGSQLGGSQAGVRATYRVGRRLALTARASGGLDGTGKELALGVDWQPLAAPVHLVAERRIPIGSGMGGTAAFVVAGLDPHPVGAGFRLEAYAQVGAVVRAGVAPFADGAARLMQTVAEPRGTRLALGAGLWGGAQQGAARLDIGPSAALVLPIDGGAHAIRLALDWRQRIAGSARPGSGPVFSLGADL